MNPANPVIPAPIWQPIRLATLVRLRWLAIAGQTAGVLFVALVIGFPLPIGECLGLIGLSVALNLWLVMRLGSAERLTNRFAAIQLGYDCLQLAGLLWLTGGLGNPFSLLLLAPVSVSATTLTQRATFLLALLVAAIASVLAVFHLALPWTPEAPLQLSPIYIAGIWVSLLLGVAFIAAYTNRVAHEARQLADALAATELTLSRQQQLSALDGLAAAAAHELGTPLSTIALAAKEMRAELDDGAIADDADLIIQQAARCRAILGKLRNLENEDNNPFGRVPLHELVAEVARPHESLGKTIHISIGDHAEPEPIVARNVGLLYGLGNLIENAAHFAKRSVKIDITWQKSAFTVTITDDGDGFPLELITRLGEPYLTTRARNDDEGLAPRGGLGLGIFIAKTLLERTGAHLTFLNARSEGHAEVVVHWPAGTALES